VRCHWSKMLTPFRITRIIDRLANSNKEVERLLKFVLRGTVFFKKTYSVGGYVRDEYLGLEAKDLDIVVEMRNGAKKLTDYLHKLFPEATSRPLQKGAYPIWAIVFKDDVEYRGVEYQTKGAEIEIADSMKEQFPDESSRQRKTEHGTLEEDMERRDFTVNMLVKDLSTGKVRDVTNRSIEHLEKGVLDHISEKKLERSLRDDPLRMIRLIRFQCKYGWKIPMHVLRIVKRNSARIKIVPVERIMDEMKKVMNMGKLNRFVRLMKTIGLLKYVMPEIERMRGVEHEYTKGHHQEGDVYKHTLLVLNHAKPTVVDQMSALLHDVGKPDSREIIDGVVKFHGHESVSGEIAEAMMKRLKFDNNTIRKVRIMVENHMRPHHLSRDSTRSKALRRFIRQVGEEMVDAILDLAEADDLGNLPPEGHIPKLREKIHDIQVSALPVKQRAILNGNEIMDILGISPGPLVGDVSQWLVNLEDDYASEGRELTKDEAKYLIKERFG